MKSHNIITLRELQNFDIKDENTSWDKCLSSEEKIRNINITPNQNIDGLIIEPKIKFSLRKKIFIFIITLVIVSAEILTLKYIFYDRQNKSNYQLNIDSDKNSKLNQKIKTTKFAIPKIKIDVPKELDNNNYENDYLWRSTKDKQDSKIDDNSEKKQKTISMNKYDDKNKTKYSSRHIPKPEEYDPEKYYDWREKSGYSDKGQIYPKNLYKYNVILEYKHQDFPWEKYSSNMQIKDVDTTNSDPLLKKQIGFDHVSDENSLFDKTYYFIDTAQCSRKVNGEKVYASLKQLADSVKKASAMGITDIVFPQSSFDISAENTINQLEELVEEADLNKITLNLFLDMQFSTPERVKHLLPEYFYKKTASGNYSIYKGRYIHDQKNEMSEKYISNYINKLASIGIQNYILGELPRDISSDYNGELNIPPFINILKFKERFNTIKNSALNINLIYSYSNRLEDDEITYMDLKFSGAIFQINNLDIQNLKRDKNFVTKIFQEGENKILIFDFKLVEMKEFNMRFLLGLYLFSPIPIIINIKDENYCPYTINILYEELLTSEEIELKKKFIEIIKVKRIDTFFNKKSVSAGLSIDYQGVIMSTRGKYLHSIVEETLLYIFNYEFSDKYIPLDIIFGLNYPLNYHVIYNSKQLNNNDTILKHSGFTMTGKQLLIIKVMK